MSTKKSKNKRKIGLSAVILIAFLSFSIIIFSILWILQVSLVESFYKSSAEKEMQSIAIDIEETYIDHFFDYSDYLDDYPISENTAFIIYSTRYENNIIYNGITSKNTNDLIVNSYQWSAYLTENRTSYFSLEEDYAIYMTSFTHVDVSYYVAITTPTENLSFTVGMLKNQLFISIIISLILGGVIARVLALLISKPILKINKLVSEMSKGNFDVKFTGGPYRETDELLLALNEAITELSKADQLQKDVISNITHDFKTPLTLIKSYAEMIMDINGEDEEKRNANLGIIIDEVDRLSLVINDVLTLSKAQAKVQSQRDIISLTEVINEAVIRFEEMSILQNIKFGYSISDNIYIFANKIQIGNVVDNFLSNAFKYTNNEVFINLFVENKMAIFEVTDNGKGIPEIELENIWKRYYRSATTNIKSASGSGLGLAIVKAILDNHKFEYFVTTELNVGSTFAFKAPLYDFESEADD